MTETIGTLDLKIARFKHQLKVIEQQLAMSGGYPDHREKLRLARSQIQARLDKVIEQRRLFDLSPPLKPASPVMAGDTGTKPSPRSRVGLASSVYSSS